MIIGFTGSRLGLDVEQALAIRKVLIAEHPTYVVHGDCVGADAEFHRIAQHLSIPIMLRPSDLPFQRAFSKGAVKVYDPELPLDRNRKIVDECDILIAAPDGPERLRSGSWSTIRYAIKTHKSHVIFERRKHDRNQILQAC